MGITDAQLSLGNDSTELQSDSPAIPVVWSFKGGFSGARSFDWSRPTREPAGSRFNHAGLTVEGHYLNRFVMGIGGEFSWNRNDVKSIYFGHSTDELYAYYVYGTIGYAMWQSANRRSRTWSSLDIGQVRCSEKHSGASTATVKDDEFVGICLRLRASYLRQFIGPLAIGVTGGWQWAKPDRETRTNATSQINLSGPLIAAHISLVSPLGKSSCSH
jgi:hypothetical protein